MSDMNLQAAPSRGHKSDRSWHGTAFVLEAVALVLFIGISLAIICSLLASGFQMASDASRRTDAAILATTGAANGAEAFAANPNGAVGEELFYTVTDGVIAPADAAGDGVYTVTRTTERAATGAGSLYSATITVAYEGNEVYTLTTSSYVSDRGGEGVEE